MKSIFPFVLLGIVLLVMFVVGGFSIVALQNTTVDLNNTEAELVSCNNEKLVLYSDKVKLQDKIVELQENMEYSKLQVFNARKERDELQEVYNNVWYDATTCYFANVCAYYEQDCIDYFKDPIWENKFDGWTAQEIHIYYSNLCDGLIRDWDEYQSFNTYEVE